MTAIYEERTTTETTAVALKCDCCKKEYPQSRKETLTQINAICDQWTERGDKNERFNVSSIT